MTSPLSIRPFLPPLFAVSEEILTTLNRIEDTSTKHAISSLLQQAASAFIELPHDPKHDRELIQIKIDYFKKSYLQCERVDTIPTSSDRAIAEKVFSLALNMLQTRLQSGDCKNIVSEIKKSIASRQYQNAHDQLQLLRFHFTPEPELIITIYDCLHEIIEHLDLQQVTNNGMIQVLLNDSKSYTRQQLRLAVDLAKYHESKSLLGLQYYAKALQIAKRYYPGDAEPLHQNTSKQLLEWVYNHFIASRVLVDKASDARRRNNPELFAIVYTELTALGRYCSSDCLKPLYQEIGASITDLAPNWLKNYAPLITEKLCQTTLSPLLITRTFETRLCQFRDVFKEPSISLTDYEAVRKFQRTISGQFKSFVFGTFIQDGLALFGLEGQEFDIRLVGSAAREEVCPYSDLEWFICINDENYKQQFVHFMQWIRIQILSLGETPTLDVFVFSCLGDKHPSGLHIDIFDQNTDSESVVKTPGDLARLQNQNISTHPETVNLPCNIILTSDSLFATTPTLFHQYQEALKTILPPTKRQQRALSKIKERMKDYSKCWKHHISDITTVNIKTHFVELLNLLLGDMRLYFDIQETNTLDIIDRIPVFNDTSKHLLKAAVSSIFMIRVRHHLKHSEQIETITFEHLAPEEESALSTAYWMVLLPLYSYLEKQGINEESRIDLEQSAFDTLINLRTQKYQRAALNCLIRSLFSRNAPLERHIHYYKTLALHTSCDHLRQVYIEKCINPVLHSILLDIPSPSGYRMIEVLESHAVTSALHEMTSDRIEVTANSLSAMISTGGSEKPRYIKKNLIPALFDAHGHIQASYNGPLCLKPVRAPSHLLGRERAAALLLMRLFGHGALVPELIRVTVFKKTKKIAEYYVLASKNIHGETLDKISGEKLSTLDPKCLSDLFLSIPIIMPGNLRDWHYISTSKNEVIHSLICTDNAHAWTQPSSVYSALFSKFPDFILDSDSIKAFLAIKPDELLKHWLADMHIWNTETEAAFSTNTHTCLLEPEAGTNLLLQIYRLQAFLSTHTSRPIAARELMHFGHDTHRASQPSKEAPHHTPVCSPKTAIEEINMMLSVQHERGFWLIQNQTHKKLVGGFTGGSNNILAQQSTLKGLLGHSYETLNLSNCYALTDEILGQFCKQSHAHLKVLDIRSCPQLTHSVLYTIAKYCQNLEELFIANGDKIQAIHAKKMPLTPIKPLRFDRLKTLVISNQKNLTSIKIKTPLLYTLKLENNPQLQSVEVECSPALQPELNECPQITLKTIYSFPAPSIAVQVNDEAVIPKETDSVTQMHFLDQIYEMLVARDPQIRTDIARGQKSTKDPLELLHCLHPLSLNALHTEIDRFIVDNPDSKKEKLLEQVVKRLMHIPKNDAEKVTLLPLESSNASLFVANPHNYNWQNETKQESSRIHIPDDPMIDQIMTYIRQGQAASAVVMDKEMIAVIGNTGCGKSTAFNYLMGCEMSKSEEGVSALNPYVAIGHDMLRSETLSPIAFLLNNSALCDMPGFLDTREQEIRIANAVNIRNCFARANSSKIIFLISHLSLRADRAGGVSAAIGLLITLFGSLENLRKNLKSILFGVTFAKKKTPFEQIQDQIIEAARLQSLSLDEYKDQIIPISPLEPSLREPLLGKIDALVPIENAQNIYSSALTASDMHYISKIVDGIVQNIRTCWDAWDIDSIVQEYTKLQALDVVTYPHSILQPVKASIFEHIEALKVRIKTIISSHEPSERLEIKSQLEKLCKCHLLNELFPEAHISAGITEIEDAVKQTEKAMQDKVRQVIEDDVTICIKKLKEALQRIFEHQRSKLAYLVVEGRPPLQLLSQEYSLSAADDLQFLFNEIDKESALRPYKYCFKDQIPLAEYKSDVEKTLSKILVDFHARAKKEELLSHFSAALNGLEKSIERAVYDHCQRLSRKQFTVKELHLLKEYLPGIAERLVESIGELPQVLDDKEYADCQRQVQQLLDHLHTKSRHMHIERYAEQLYNSMCTLLTNPLDNSKLTELNDFFKALYKYDMKRYQAAQQIADTRFVDSSRDEIVALEQTIDDQYATKVKAIFERRLQMELLSACFTNQDAVKQFWQQLQVAIEKKEELRWQTQVHRLDMLLKDGFFSLQTRLKQLAFSEAKKISEITSVRDPAVLLSTFEAIDPQMALCKQAWNELQKALFASSQHYCFIQSQDLVKMNQSYGKDIVKFCMSIIDLAKANVLAAQFDTALKGLYTSTRRKSTTTDIAITALLSHIDASMRSLLEDILLESPTAEALYASLNELHNLHKRPFAIQEIHDVYESKKKQWIVSAGAMYSQIKKERVAVIVQSITSSCLKREFNEILPTIASELTFLQREEPESYHSVSATIEEAVNAWQVQELTPWLTNKQYTNAIALFVTLHKLQATLSEHIVIHTADAVEVLNTHLIELLKEATAEIRAAAPTRLITNLTSLRHFISALRALQGHNLRVHVTKEVLQEQAKTRWREIAQSKSLLQNCEQITKELIKHYAVAEELSCIPQFKAAFQPLFQSVFSDDDVEQIGMYIDDWTSNSDDGRAAAMIVDLFPDFYRIRIKKMNQKASSISFSTALEKLETTASVSKLDELAQRFYALYNIHLENILAKRFDNQSMIRKTKELGRALSNQTLFSHQEESIELLATIFAVWTHLDTQNGALSTDRIYLLQPHSTQVLAMLQLIGISTPGPLQNHLLQIKTGEGKSICLGISALFFALQEYDVTVCCFSSYLSERDRKAFSPLFRAFLVESRISYGTMQHVVNNMMQSHLPNMRTQVQDFLKNERVTPFKTREKKNLLLLDEVDVFFGQEFYAHTYYPITRVSSSSITAFVRYVWENRTQLRKQDTESFLQLPMMHKILREFPRLKFFISSIIKRMRSDLALFPESGHILHKCHVIDNQIGYQDNWGNFSFCSYTGYATSFAYLYYQEKKQIVGDIDNHLFFHVCAGSILYSELPNFFKVKIGLTATLKALSNEENKILDAYGFTQRSYIPSTFQKQRLQQGATEVFEVEQDYLNAIKLEIDKVLDNGRACLIVVDDTDRLKKVSEFLRKCQRYHARYRTPELLSEDIPDNEKEAVIMRACTQYKITIITRRYGRGSDFICRDAALLRNGGMHLIVTFFPETEAEQEQIAGRTCRQDNPGSMKLLLLADDLLRQKLVGSKIVEEETVPDLRELTGDVYAVLQSKRNALYQDLLSQKEPKLQKAQKEHENTLSLSSAIESNNEALALELLTKINGGD